MGIETGTYISDLVPQNPLGADDLNTADDHLRLIKSLVQQTLPNLNGEVSATPGDLNRVVLMRGVTGEVSATTGDFNRLTLLRGIATDVSATGGALNRIAKITPYGKSLVDSNGSISATSASIVALFCTNISTSSISASAVETVDLLCTGTISAGAVVSPVIRGETISASAVYSPILKTSALSASSVHSFSLRSTNNTTVDGDLYVGQAAPTTGIDVVGASFSNGQMTIKRTAGVPVLINRGSDDGNLVQFYQADNLEGAISVSGATVTYGSFCGAHWTQGVPHETLSGTLLSSTAELCEWPNEKNETLTKCRITKVICDPAIVGVFIRPDDADSWQAGLGFYKARVCGEGGSITVGDLLCSSSVPGVAMRQADNVLRSYTLGKARGTFDGEGEATIPVTLYAG